MFTIKALAEMYDRTPKQIRDRVTALKPLIDVYSRDGKENAIQYTDQGRAMLDRLLQVESQNGLTIKAAAEQVKEEFQSHFPGENGHVDEDLLDRIYELESQLDEQSKDYEKRIADLHAHIQKHHGRIQGLEDVVYPMLEAPSEETASTGAQADGRQAAEGHVHIQSTVEADEHDQNGHASADGSHEDDSRIEEIAVDGDLPRWRRVLNSIPLVSRMFMT